MSGLQALKAMESSREKILQTLDLFTPDQLEKAHFVGEWTIKDMISHLIAWDNALLSIITQIPTDEFDLNKDFLDHIAFNAQAVATRRHSPYHKVWEEFREVRTALVDAAVSLSEDLKEEQVPSPMGGSASVIEWLLGLAWHEEEHTKELLQLAKSLADQ